MRLPHESEVNRQNLLLISSVDARHIPNSSAPTSHYNRFARIARNEVRLVPNRWKCGKELLNIMRLRQITFRTVCQMLQTTLEEHSQSEFVSMRSDVGMLRVAECARGIVHRTNDISSERQHGIMRGGLCCKGRHVVIPFCTIYALCTHQVRPSSLPATRNGSTMKVNEQMMTSCTLQQVNAVVHIHLIISRKEVNLHASHTNPFAPSKLLLTVFRLVQAELRTRRTIYPSNRRIVPNQGLHALRLRIIDCILDGLAVFHLVPFSIDENIRQFQRHRHIDIFLDNLIVI